MCFPKKKVEPVLETYIDIYETSLLLNQASTPFIVKGIKFNTMTHYYYYHLIGKKLPLSEILEAEVSDIKMRIGERLFEDSINPYSHVLNFDYKRSINILISGLFEKFKQNDAALLELLSNNSYINIHMEDAFLGSQYNVLGIVLMYVRGLFMEGTGLKDTSLTLLQRLLERLGDLEQEAH